MQDKMNAHGYWRFIEVFWSKTTGLCKKQNIITCNPLTWWSMMLWFYSEVFLCTRADDHVLQHELVLQQEQGCHKVCLRFISDLEIVHKRQYFFFILSLRLSLPSVLKSLFPGLNGTAWAFWTPLCVLTQMIHVQMLIIITNALIFL